MQTVTLTRIDSGFVNVEPTYLVGDHFDGTSHLQHEPVDYVLPDGYEVAESVIGDLAIYGADNKRCDVVARKNGEPLLIATDADTLLVRASVATAIADAEEKWGGTVAAARHLAIARSTWQGYKSGERAMPEYVLRSILAHLEVDRLSATSA